jgi:hypothetical protein
MPGVISTAKELATRKYVANYNINNLFSKGIFTSPQTSLNDLLSTAVARIQNIGNTSNSNGLSINQMMPNARMAFRAIHEQRLIDQSPLLANLTLYFGYQPSMLNPPRKAIEGTSYDSVDVTATEAQHPGFAQEYSNFWQMIGKVSNKDPAWGEFASNNMAIQAIQILDSSINIPATMKTILIL